MNSVLIIDDDKELCALMKKCVEQENLSAVVAYGGLEGLRLLEENKGRDIEIMTHPGYCDLELYRESSYSTQRVQELDALCSQEVMDYVKENGIELTHYEAQ